VLVSPEIRQASEHRGIGEGRERRHAQRIGGKCTNDRKEKCTSREWDRKHIKTKHPQPNTFSVCFENERGRGRNALHQVAPAAAQDGSSQFPESSLSFAQPSTC
jgi:hypothetical protein